MTLLFGYIKAGGLIEVIYLGEHSRVPALLNRPLIQLVARTGKTKLY